MTVWTLSTREKKNVEHITIWCAGGRCVVRTEWYRWGSWTVESDSKPDIDLDNPDGYEVWGSDLDWELVDMTDGVGGGWEWPESMSAEEREQFEQVYDQEGCDAIGDLGWGDPETEVHLHGALELT
jgi:hypothetical protein